MPIQEVQLHPFQDQTDWLIELDLKVFISCLGIFEMLDHPFVEIPVTVPGCTPQVVLTVTVRWPIHAHSIGSKSHLEWQLQDNVEIKLKPKADSPLRCPRYVSPHNRRNF